jgi:lipopolysaccharide transport system ATP-binding protein
MRNPIGWLASWQRNQRQVREEFWALKQVSFEVPKGQVLGLIGRNGAGKSTLLKILSRITEPSEGRIHLRGRVASLLEVGTGFHAELTGRENVFLNGAILGMSKAEIRRKFDEIVAFSEVENFLDTPVKHYSSGMYVRLAFAVAAHLEPEILIVDEVLAVGDAIFQKKCLGKMGEVARGGRTVLFVSHNVGAVRSLCQRAVLLKNGRIERDGDVEAVLETYVQTPFEGFGRHENKQYGLVIDKVSLKNEFAQESAEFQPGDELSVEVHFTATKPIYRPYIAIVVESRKGNCFTANMLLDGNRPEMLSGAGVFRCTFQSIPLLPQQYTIKLAIRDKNRTDLIVNYLDVATFAVAGNLEDYGFKGEYQSLCTISTPVMVPYTWELPDGTVASVSLNQPASLS